MSHTFYSLRAGTNPHPDGLPLDDIKDLFEGVYRSLHAESYFDEAFRSLLRRCWGHVRAPAHDGHDSETMADSVPTAWRTVFRRHGGHSGGCGRNSVRHDFGTLRATPHEAGSGFSPGSGVSTQAFYIATLRPFCTGSEGWPRRGLRCVRSKRYSGYTCWAASPAAGGSAGRWAAARRRWPSACGGRRRPG